MSTTDQSGVKNVSDTISSTLESSDEQTAQGLQTLGLVHQARLAQLTRTAAAVTANFGKKSPQAAAAEAAVSAGQATVARIDIVSKQLTTAAPEVPAGGWILHGRVYDAQGTPVGNQTVFLVDAQFAYQSEYGFAYTDDTGYFVLTTAGASPQSDPAGTSEPEPQPDLYVEVANEKRQPVYLASAPVQPTIGTVTYLTIAKSEKPIGNPPRAVSGSALPTRTRKARTNARTKAKSAPRRSRRKSS